MGIYNMYIEPNSTIQFFDDIPLTKNYTDTFYFPGGRQEQNVFFSSKIKKTISANSYQRSSRGFIKVEGKIKDFINFTYLRFLNNSHEQKWFYAFIVDEPQYVNENTVLINYEIDIMQTWLLNVDYELLQCLVEREHTETDVIGEHLQAEPVDIGEPITLDVVESGYFEHLSVVFFEQMFLDFN